MTEFRDYYYDLKICSFRKYNIWEYLNDIEPSIKDKIKAFQRQISINLKNVNLQSRFYPNRVSTIYFKQIVSKIFPAEIFGSYYNFKKFYGIIKKMCTATFYENVTHRSLVNKWRLFDVKWMKNVENGKKESILIQIVIWLSNIFKTKIMNKLFFVQRSLKSYEVNYFPMREYRSLHDKAIDDMVKSKQLLICPNKLADFCKTNLYIIPKSRMTSCRPLVHTSLLSEIQANEVIPFFKHQGQTFSRNLCNAWSDFVKASKNQPIYGIKMDLKDAFSNINIDTLKPFIAEFLSHKPGVRDAILNSLKNKPIKVNQRYYLWNRGLMQGMRLSAKLCELSRSYFDKEHLSTYINGKNFFFRTTDDYLFCSVNKEDVLRVKNILEENCVIAKEKTVSNLDGDSKILFTGRIFNLQTKEIEINVNTDLQSYRYRSKLLYKKDVDKPDPTTYLNKVGRMMTNSFNFDSILFNLEFNSKKTVLQNYFKAMVSLAFKMECAIKERLEEEPRYLDVFITKLILYYTRKIRNKLVQQKPIREEPMELGRRVFKFIGIKAFILVLQKRYLWYKNTIVTLKQHIKRIRSPLIGKNFKQIPQEFDKVYMKRVLPKAK